MTPNTLDPDSESESSVVRLAQNRDVASLLGWHVMRNGSYETRNTTFIARDNIEETLFVTGAWAPMEPPSSGAKTLEVRLTNVLKDQILLQLQSLLDEIGAGESYNVLAQFCSSGATIAQQRRYFLRLGHSALIK